MSLIKKVISLTIFFAASFAFSQNVSNIEHDTMKATKKVKLTTKSSDLPYRMKVVERRDYKFAFKEEDKGKLNQDRIILPAYVTKEVYLDNDRDSYYDKMLVIRYIKDYEDKLEVLPLGKQVIVMFNGKQSDPIKKAGFYMTDAKNNDFFFVEEMKIF